MFEKSESDNSQLFTMVQAIFLLIDASLGSGVPKRVVLTCFVASKTLSHYRASV